MNKRNAIKEAYDNYFKLKGINFDYEFLSSQSKVDKNGWCYTLPNIYTFDTEYFDIITNGVDEVMSRPKSLRYIDLIIDTELNYKNVRYGMLVKVLSKDGSSYHSGCKVHFYNKKGVLVGNYYEFLPYERLRIRPKGVQYPRYFYGKRFEFVKDAIFRIALKLTDTLIRVTQEVYQK